MINIDIDNLTLEQLRDVAKIYNIARRWNMNKDKLLRLVKEAIKRENKKNIFNEISVESEENDKQFINKFEEIKSKAQENKNKIDNINSNQKEISQEEFYKTNNIIINNGSNRRGNRKKHIQIFKDGILILTIEGLIETMKWASENNICNSGWIRESLRTGRETIAGRKYKVGGYKFQYK